MATNDRPAAPEEKLYTRLQIARETGKEFDEAKERAILGIPLPQGMTPLFIPEAAERTASTLRADAADAVARIKAEATATSEEELRQENVRLKAELHAEKQRVAEVTGTTPPPPTPQPAEPQASPTANPTAFPQGAPNEQWTARQLIEFHRASALEPALPRGGVGMSKRAILDQIMGALEKVPAEAAPPAEGVTE